MLLALLQPSLKRFVFFSKRARFVEKLAVDAERIVHRYLVDAHKLISAQLHDDITQVINRLMHDLEIGF